MTVTTVTGEIDASELGVVLPHEHLVADATAQWQMPETREALIEAIQDVSPDRRVASQMEPFFYRSVLQNNDLVTTMNDVQGFIDSGGSTVVDLSPPGFGRDPKALKSISLITGLNVIMGCGEYVDFAHSPYVRHCSAEQIGDGLISELEGGVGNTGIRPGIIGELGTSNPVTENEEKILRAAARAHGQTGVAINIHRTVFPDPLAGLHALDIVLNEGVDPGKVVLSHCDERPEPECALEVGKRGAFIELDTFGMEYWATNWEQKGELVARSYDRDRIELLETVLNAGYLDQLLLSQDVCMKTMLRRHGGGGYNHITNNIEPQLRAADISQEVIDHIRIANPRRLLDVND